MIALGSKTVAICNVVDAMVAREAHGAIYTHAGPEIGVASTKAFTAQLTALFLLALKLGQLRGARRRPIRRADRGAEPHSRQDRRSSARVLAQCEQLAKELFHRARFPLPRPRHPLPHRP
jgi:glucosamine--fructose-6-phosphate aminotransferase (isomerizing)